MNRVVLIILFFMFATRFFLSTGMNSKLLPQLLYDIPINNTANKIVFSDDLAIMMILYQNNSFQAYGLQKKRKKIFKDALQNVCSRLPKPFYVHGEHMAVYFQSKKKDTFLLFVFNIKKAGKKIFEIKLNRHDTWELTKNGNYVVVLYEGKRLQLFDLTVAQNKSQNESQNERILQADSYTLSKNSKFLAIKINRDSCLHIYELSNNFREIFACINVVKSSFVFEGKYLAVEFACRTLKVYDLMDNAEEIFEKKLGDIQFTEIFCSNGNSLIVLFRDFSLHIYDLCRNEQIKKTNFLYELCEYDTEKKNENIFPKVQCFQLSPSGRFLGVEFKNKTLQFYDLYNRVLKMLQYNICGLAGSGSDSWYFISDKAHIAGIIKQKALCLYDYKQDKKIQDVCLKNYYTTAKKCSYIAAAYKKTIEEKSTKCKFVRVAEERHRASIFELLKKKGKK